MEADFFFVWPLNGSRDDLQSESRQTAQLVVLLCLVQNHLIASQAASSSF